VEQRTGFVPALSSVFQFYVLRKVQPIRVRPLLPNPGWQAMFAEYPRLSDGLPLVCLGGLPTPITRLATLDASSGARVFVKRDDLAGDVYGGNKVRKLETLLGEAIKAGAKGILTFGFVSSGHALATTIYGRKLGLPVTCILFAEEPDATAREHLLLHYYYGATLVHCPVDRFIQERDTIVGAQVAKFAAAHGTPPFILPVGGSSALGTVPYVNAAFELKQQIDEGALPEPDYVYVPLASTGTAAGLACGLRASGLKTKVIAVKVVDPEYGKEEWLLSHFSDTNELLHSLDPSFPLLSPANMNLEIRDEFCGRGYAVPTRESLDAISLAATEGLKLETTYTGKTFAALLHDLRSGKLAGKTVLFWHTANSRDLSSHVAGLDHHPLPRDFHQYFQAPV